MLVHNGKLKIQEEYAQKEKDLEIQQRVSRSAAIGNARVKKMKSRDELLEVLKQECAAKLSKASQGKNYSALIKQLIIQGLIKIEEDTVEIQCRQEDASKVQQVVSKALLLH